jgi:photosystem II stability/assembly factor-like uncharacterized protein
MLEVMQGNDEEEEDDEERKKEEGRFKAWAKKRANPDVTKFTSAILTDDEKAALLGDKGIRFHPAAWTTYP